MSQSEFVRPLTDERRLAVITELGAKALVYALGEAIAADDDMRREMRMRADSYGFAAQLFSYASPESCTSIVHVAEHMRDYVMRPARTTVELKNGETLEITHYGPPLGWSIQCNAPRKSRRGGNRWFLGALGVRSANPARHESASVSVSIRGFDWPDFPDLHPADVHGLVQWFRVRASSQS
jgi:hypothetical protein